MRRQLVSDSQQVQVPIRRINIPVDLKSSGQSTEQRKDVRSSTTEKNCPKCLEKRLIQHYMSRGCTPVIKGGCDCPSRYECPLSARLTNQSKVFPINYRSEDSLSCRSVDCGLHSEPKLDMDCTPVYGNNQCCPIRYICRKY